MNDDDYLWTGEGPVSLEIAGLERELRSLRWRPRELSLPDAAPPVEPQNQAERHDRRRMVPLVAGLAAAAAIFAVLAWLRAPIVDSSEPPASTDPAAQPSGSPELLELIDPFAGEARRAPTPTTEAPELLDPFSDEPKHAPERPSPDLKDPFAKSPEPSPPAPPRERTRSPDLVDPFYRDGKSTPNRAGKLLDPFSDEPAEPPKSSPELKDPFRR